MVIGESVFVVFIYILYFFNFDWKEWHCRSTCGASVAGICRFTVNLDQRVDFILIFWRIPYVFRSGMVTVTVNQLQPWGG